MSGSQVATTNTNGTFTVSASSSGGIRNIAVTSYTLNPSTNTATVNLASAVLAGETIYLSYNDPNDTTDDPAVLQDVAGNDTASFSGFAITNSTSAASAIALTNDNGASGTDEVSADNTTTATFTAPSGGTYNVAPQGSTTPVNDSSVTDNNGSYTANPPDGNWADGTYDILDANNNIVGSFTIDTRVTGLTIDISGSTDTGEDDTITSVGLPILTFSGEPNLTIAILGADGTTLLTPETQYTVSFSNGIYTIAITDADPPAEYQQPFGTFSNGEPSANFPYAADGIYTIRATDPAGNTGIIGTFEIATQGRDNDGADDTFETSKDGNGDGVNDDKQRSVATFATSAGAAATIAVNLIEQSSTTDPLTGGRLDASTIILFEGLSGNAETTTGATISGLQNTVNQDPDTSDLPDAADSVLAVSDQPSFRIIPEIVRTGTVDATQETNFRSDVTERFSNTIQQIDLFFEEGQQAWNALFKRDGNGGYFFFGYNSVTGLGGILLDRDNNGAVDGARLFLKDGELGDLDGQRNGVIQDPIGFVSLSAAPTLRLSDDGLGLIVDGVAGAGLWVNFETLSALAAWQNGLELITSDGTALGAVGGTPDSGNLGSKEIYLAAGQELRFAQSSRNNALVTTPGIRLVGDDGGFHLRLDDNGSADRDYNDLKLRITSSLTATDPNVIAMARLQRDSSDGILDLTGIPAVGATLNFSILTDCSYINHFGLVRLDGDAITGYSVTARLFLRSVPSGIDGPMMDAVSGREVNAFLLSARDRLATGSVKTRVNHLRAFLRFAHVEGLVAGDLGEAVPSVAGWTHTRIPASIAPDAVAELIDSCDARRPTQVRDRAILLLLARLGLRSIEIARLELGDIDWRAGEITIRGKGRRRDVLPLPDEVGHALVAYLQGARGPDRGSRRVFLMARAPGGPIKADLVHDVVRRACRRTGQPVRVDRAQPGTLGSVVDDP